MYFCASTSDGNDTHGKLTLTFVGNNREKNIIMKLNKRNKGCTSVNLFNVNILYHPGASKKNQSNVLVFLFPTFVWKVIVLFYLQ